MKLFLAAEAKHPESIARLRDFVSGFDNKHIAYIPTAANGLGYGSWKASGSIQVVHSLGAQVSVIELEKSNHLDVLEQIKGADIIWFAGGMAGYLMYWIRRVGLDTVLKDWLNEGMVYVGSSAGSMITGPSLSVAEWYLDGSEPGASLLPGLGLVDFEIFPHYVDSQLPEIKTRHHGAPLYLLKNGEAITVVDEQVKVLGERRVANEQKA